MHYLITGAARGIGRGLTRILLSQGHRVFLLDNDAAELAHTLSKAAEWVGPLSQSHSTSPPSSQQPPFQGLTLDLSSRAALRAAIPAIAAFCNGRLDVLVNNAFPTPHTWVPAGADMADQALEIEAQWDEKIAVGLTAPFLLSRYCVGLLSAAGAAGAAGAARDGGMGPGTGTGTATGTGAATSPCIINISSTRATQAEPNHEAYSAVKAGLLGLTRSMAVTLGPSYGIRVNAIVLGWIDVSGECRAGDERKREGKRAGEVLSAEDHGWHLVGRVGRVEDVAGAVRYLAEAGFVTGEEVVLDGGVGRKMVYPE